MGIFSRLLKKRKKRSDEEINRIRRETYPTPGVFEVNPSQHKNKRKLKRRKDKKDEYEISRDRVKNLIK